MIRMVSLWCGSILRSKPLPDDWKRVRGDSTNPVPGDGLKREQNGAIVAIPTIALRGDGRHQNLITKPADGCAV